MKTIRVLVMLLSAVAWFSAAQVRADDPDYQKVGSLSFEIIGKVRQVYQLTETVPKDVRYGTERQNLLAGFHVVNFHAQAIVKLVPSGDANRDSMLKKARRIRSYLDKLEDLAKSLDDKADKNDDEAIEQIARKIRSHIRKMEKSPRKLKDEIGLSRIGLSSRELRDRALSIEVSHESNFTNATRPDICEILLCLEP